MRVTDSNASGSIAPAGPYGAETPALFTQMSRPPAATAASATSNPGQTEVCDNLDNNCNLTVDEGCDDDKDMFCDGNMTVVGTPAACPSGNGDCNDNVATIKPGPTTIENCSTTADDNCDGALDGLNAIGCVNYYMDADGDGFTAAVDCDRGAQLVAIGKRVDDEFPAQG